MKKIVLLQETRVVGCVKTETVGALVRFYAECHAPLSGIWRAYLVCEEQEWLIGVLVPKEDGSFCAQGNVAKRELPNVCACYGVIRSDVWVSCACPQTVFRDSVLQASMKPANGVLADSNEHPTKIAVPLRDGCAFAPALCLARMMHYRGEDWAVLGVDENGNPVCVSEQNGNHLV